jgi:hypothetical protein
MAPKNSPARGVNASGRATSKRQGPRPGDAGDCGVNAVCRACLKGFRGRPGQAFCGPRCRLLSWTVGQLKRTLEAGEADGLKARVRELTAASGGGLTIEVVHVGSPKPGENDIKPEG